MSDESSLWPTVGLGSNRSPSSRHSPLCWLGSLVGLRACSRLIVSKSIGNHVVLAPSHPQARQPRVVACERTIAFAFRIFSHFPTASIYGHKMDEVDGTGLLLCIFHTYHHFNFNLLLCATVDDTTNVAV